MPTGSQLKGIVWEAIVAQVRAEEDTCWLCGHPIDMTFHHLDKWAFTVDHVIPRALRPDLAFDRGNCRAAHRDCNVRRQTKPYAHEPTSRRW